MIEVKNLVRTFKSGDRTIQPVNDVSFQLEQGTLASIVGKSGSGKSTLLSLLGALDKPTSGDVLVNGVSLAGMPDSKLTEYRRRDIGFVFQQFNLIPTLTAAENVEIAMPPRKMPRADRLARVAKLLEQVGRVGRLVGGHAQHGDRRPGLGESDRLLGRPSGRWSETAPEVLASLARRTTHTGAASSVGNSLDATAPCVPHVAAIGFLPGDPADVVVVDAEDGRPVALWVRNDEAGSPSGWTHPVMTSLATENATTVVARAMTRPARTRFDPVACVDAAGAYVGLLHVEHLVTAAMTGLA